MSRHPWIIPIAATVLVGHSLIGQGHLTVPASLAGQDGLGADTGLGLTFPQRQQIVIAASHLSGAENRTITEIWLRRDRSIAEALPGGQVDLVVKASWTSIAFDRVSTRFDLNHDPHSLVEAFRGRVAIPRSPIPSGTEEQAFWAPDNRLSILLQTAIVVPSVLTTLCLDVTGTPVTGASSQFWPLDYHLASDNGATSIIGTACGPTANARRASLRARTSTLRIGSTALISALGPYDSQAVLLLGSQLFQPPLDLSFLGAPGCFVYVQPDLTLYSRFSSQVDPAIPGTLGVEITLPLLPTLAGRSLYAQSFALALPLAASEGLAMTIAAAPPNLQASTVTTPLGVQLSSPQVGNVDTSSSPVLRLILGG